LAADGSWEGLEFATRPLAVGPHAVGPHAVNPLAVNDDARLAQRLRSQFGVELADLREAPHAQEVWPELREFIGERLVLAPDGELARTWVRELEGVGSDDTGRALPPLTILGLEEVALTLSPGRLALRRDGLVRALVPKELAPSTPGALLPPHVLVALADLVARFQKRGPLAHAVAVRGWCEAAAAFRATDSEAAQRLYVVMDLVDRPLRWATTLQSLAGVTLRDDVLQRAAALELDEDDPLGALDPAWIRNDPPSGEEDDDAPFPPDREGPTPFAPEDLRVLDEVFREQLPTLFGAPGQYRRSQHRVAEAIAAALGEDHFVLVHAPTGTGKTLAYLLPCLLFARRHEVRVGIATYTRALQEQAMDREVPRALAALGRAGLAPGFIVSTLKGREHSLCWRALRATTPQRMDEPETWLAWTSLVLFALADVDGDLDRFPSRAPIRLMAERPWRQRISALLRQVRARAGCCAHADDRQRCAAEVARRRAERSHVVITNQSFALARPEFFKRIVFDECEHLHDQAGNAYSVRYALERAPEAVVRLSVPGTRTDSAKGERGGGALDRLLRALPLGTSLTGHVEGARHEAHQLLFALGRLTRELEAFEAWRDERRGTLDPRHEHALFRIYAEGLAGREAGRFDAAQHELAEDLGGPDESERTFDVNDERTRSDGVWEPGADPTNRMMSDGVGGSATRDGRGAERVEDKRETASGLVDARERVAASAGRLDGWLATIHEELELLRMQRLGRIRRALELGRQDLAELGLALGQWLPVEEAAPKFTRAYFHDVERDARGGLVLCARVLLPDRLLGRDVLPKFHAAAFVSATTKLGGSFDTARRYLGLDQLAATIPGVPEGPLTVEYDPAEVHGDPTLDGPPGEAVQPMRPRSVRTVSAPEVFDYSRVLIGVPLDLPSPQRERGLWIERVSAWLPTLAEHTGGRILGLFTSLEDVRAIAERVAPEFRARSLPFYWQGMDGAGKEELAEIFRERVEATLLGVDTFWYGADFPGETLEVVLIARLPYGVPDRFHYAQCAVLGEHVQRHRIYMPRALAKFRQGFGRLMRRSSDRGVVISLDARLAERRHAAFLRELPLPRAGIPGVERGAEYVQGDLVTVTAAALAHLGRTRTPQRAGEPRGANERRASGPAKDAAASSKSHAESGAGPIDIDLDELPF